MKQISFDSIREEIERDVKERETQETPLPAKEAPDLDPDTGMPAPSKRTFGVLVSKPGTEKVLFDASTFQLMECDSSAVRVKKRRVCIVEKDVKPTYANQFINSQGYRTHVVTREVFNLLMGVLSSVRKQLKAYDEELEKTKEQLATKDLLINTLRKNGIID